MCHYKKTIDIILHKVYTEKRIKTKIPRNKMKELLLLCTQGVPFTFNGETYMQIDGVMMGSPLGALFANIFMCELENTIIPKLDQTIQSWTRYVDDTFAFIKIEHLERVKRELNGFHANIKFTHELEDEGTIPFLDVRITKVEDDQIETSVYRKETNTDIYMNWYSHAPTIWKIATLKSLIRRAFLVSSKSDTLNVELIHLKNTFCDRNDYPRNMVEKIIENERLLQQVNIEAEQESPNDDEEEKEEPVTLSLNLPYAGMKGENLVLKLRKYISKVVNKSKNLVSVNTIYKAKRLGASFNIKDKIKFEHQHNVVYHSECPNKKCTSQYTGETRCRIEKRIAQHHGKDKNSHLFRHAERTKHKRVDKHSFKIIGQGYRSNFARKISESLYIKKLKPDLNVQKDSYKLVLFN